MKLKRKLGFSLVEVLVFVSVIGIFFVTAATISSFSLQVAKSNENKILATRYAEALMEWLRGEKEADWDAFKTKLGGAASSSWCFDQTPISDTNGWQTNAPCSTYDLQNIYKRDLKISTTSDPDQLVAEVTVSWKEGANILSVPVKTVFSRFE